MCTYVFKQVTPLHVMRKLMLCTMCFVMHYCITSDSQLQSCLQFAHRTLNYSM